MKYYAKVKSYFNTPNRCFIPKCKARCCTNAPLPEDFLPRFQSRIQRNIYSGVNIGQNDPRDTFNSIIYNTTTNPIQLFGRDAEGHMLVGIPPQVMEELQIKSMEQVQALLKTYNQFDNYCPFITDYARCAVYEHRPSICREFGSTHLKIDRCAEKASRLDVIKFYVKHFFDFKGTLKFAKDSIVQKFAKG